MNYSHFIASFNRFSGIDSEYANECELTDLMGDDEFDGEPLTDTDTSVREPWMPPPSSRPSLGR